MSRSSSGKKKFRFARQCLAYLGLGIVLASGVAGFLYGGTVQAADAPKIYAPVLNTPIPGLDFTKTPVVYSPDRGTLSIPFLSAYVGAAYQYLIGVSVIAAAVMIVYGGFKYILAASTGASDGKQIITDALIGLMLIFGTYSILAALNPTSLTQLKPLEVKYVMPDPLQISIINSDGVPYSSMPSWDQPPPSPPSAPVASPPPAASTPGQPPPGFKEGCGKGSPYTVPAALCGSFEDCKSRFCDRKDFTPPAGLPDPAKDMVGFLDIFPSNQKDTILQKGLAFFTVKELCAPPKGCSTKNIFGPSWQKGVAKEASNYNLMAGGMIFRPEARDALIAAGAEAKKRGYFLLIGDGTRTMSGVSQVWCARLQDPKYKGHAGGLALPGTSPHLLGIAVDLQLNQLIGDGSSYVQRTQIGVCGQVASVNANGIQYMRALEEIMASAGFKHLASEIHHFDYLGAYPTDCTTADFPAQFQTKEDKECR